MALAMGACDFGSATHTHAEDDAPASTDSSGLSRSEKRKRLAELKATLKAELRALKRRNDLELEELKASQAARRKEWDAAEKKARNEFLASTKDRDERRAYFKSFRERRRALVKMLKGEWEERKREHQVRLKATQSEQAQKLREFTASLDKGE